MSGRIIGEVLDYAPTDLTPAERLVLICLADRARDTDRTARQGTTSAAIANRTCLTIGTVKNALSSLARRAIIQPQHKARRGLAQDYKITPLSEYHRFTTNKKGSLTDDPNEPERVTVG